MTCSENQLYKKLILNNRKASLLGSLSSLLDWDQETYMPKDAANFRAEQQGFISTLLHKEKTSKNFAKLLNKLIDIETGTLVCNDLTPRQIASLKRFRSDYLKEVKLPVSFVSKFATLNSEATQVWAKARSINNFNTFSPYLSKIVEMCKKKAEYLGYTSHPYNALLDLFEPEMTVGVLDPLFERLRQKLSSLLEAISLKKEPEKTFLYTSCAADKQMELGRKILQLMGFESTNSRLDITTHPFCSAIFGKDIRMTTRIDEKDALSNIFTVLHEGGHGLYALGREIEHFGAPLGESCSLGIDESQSRLWETIIGRSMPFWQFFYPTLQKQFPEPFSSVSLEKFYAAINCIKPSFIRVEADEVCYCLHVIVRYEIEKALLEGSLKVNDLPGAWNAKMKQYLGIQPGNDKEGCLQDIHWSLGALGYFPTYALGNLYAAQFFAHFEKAHPEWKINMAKGDFSLVREYFRTHIHRYGREFSPAELLNKACGEQLSEKAYIEYLNKKYSALYAF